VKTRLNVKLDDEQRIDTRSKPLPQKKRLRKIQESDSETE